MTTTTATATTTTTTTTKCVSECCVRILSTSADGYNITAMYSYSSSIYFSDAPFAYRRHPTTLCCFHRALSIYTVSTDTVVIYFALYKRDALGLTSRHLLKISVFNKQRSGLLLYAYIC